MRNAFFFTIKTTRVPAVHKHRVFNNKPEFKQAAGLECASAIGERNSCTVLAVANGLGLHYFTAHAILKRLGRKYRDGYTLSANARRFGAVPRRDLKQKTVLSTVRALPRGRFWVSVRGHIFAVVDNVIRDFSCGSVLRHVRNVYQLPETRPERLLTWSEPKLLAPAGVNNAASVNGGL